MPPPTNKTALKLRPRRLGWAIVVLFWVIVLAVGMYNRQGISDWWMLRGYHAPAAVASIASQDTMTSYARKVFYVNKPDIATKGDFAHLCPSGTEQTVVLGCYQSDQDGIFVLQVSDPRLNGVEQVTSAHEMLHAAYDRLSSRDKVQVDAWLEDFYQHDLTDATVKTQIADYQQSEPHDVVNEMHSLFGTEVAQLTPQLESYYRRYFSNRAAVVQLYASYEGEFTSRQQTIKTDDAQLTAWKSQIDGDEADLKQQRSSLDSQRAQLNEYQNSGDTADYNAGVPAYNWAVNSYNAELASLQALVNQYNALVASRNSLVLETQQLTDEISSQASPVMP